MGSPPSFSTLEQQNAEFRTYIQDVTSKLQARAGTEMTEPFDTYVADYYKNNQFDRLDLAGGSYTHFAQASSFSLDGVAKIIEGVADAVFGGGAMPKGGKVNSAKAEIEKVAGVLGEFEGLALSVAIQFVNDILKAFNTTISTEWVDEREKKPLAPGLTMFTWYYGDAFRNANYFKNNYISTTIIAFNLSYSFKEAQAIQNIEWMQSMSRQLEETEANLEKFRKTYQSDIMNLKFPADELEAIKSRLDLLTDQITTMRQQVDDLVKKYPPTKAGAKPAAVAG